MADDRRTPHQVVLAELARIEAYHLAFRREETAQQLLAVIADRMRDEVGQRGCGGCDSCAQHALIDWLDPR